MIICLFFWADYFPELARQKRLLDRKHQGRRRNYWNKVPRKEREKDEHDETDFEPQWEEKEAFEESEDAGAKQDESNSQEEEDESSSQEEDNEPACTVEEDDASVAWCVT